MQEDEDQTFEAPTPKGDPSVKLEEEIVLKVEEQDNDIDPALADWLKIDDKYEKLHAEAKEEQDDYSPTDDDSDNADVVDPEEVDLDDWFKVESADEPSVIASAATESESLSTVSPTAFEPEYLLIFL
jgi:DNA ligase-4